MAKEIRSCLDIPKITNCNVDDCSYNNGGACHAVAITVGGHSPPICDTHWNSNQKGGVASLTGGVGACREDSCRFNASLECSAPDGIKVMMREGKPNCATFEKR
ncbi:MAG: DUF1540 domain-containing protein [Phycisphaerae bacterium]|nr:DUF1540 domain-containing protein [Phycisphaerae bacterium]NIW98074.1 DUF1540 domain-containing protein [Phycisphaerae bacterium]NIX29542.1 DUF1540 domain-containing protein [Phycisphaerae bacterium]